ncbi:MAG: hypothetical protein JWR38_2280 [Mucilaginibacter sp.]|nr:hypothetical protein [Mucilaginibacter sp.]
MTNITDKDIINHLEDKIKFHYSEAKRIENILLAFTSGGDLQEDQPTGRERIKLKQPGRRETGSKGLPAQKKPRKPVEIPKVFSSGLKLNGKVIYALNQIQSGFAEDIANKISELQPELEPGKVKVQISGILSGLKSKGILEAQKVGRKDLFTIKENRKAV